MELTTFGVLGKIPFPKGFPQPFFIPQKSFPEFSPDFSPGLSQRFSPKVGNRPFPLWLAAFSATYGWKQPNRFFPKSGVGEPCSFWRWRKSFPQFFPKGMHNKWNHQIPKNDLKNAQNKRVFHKYLQFPISIWIENRLLSSDVTYCLVPETLLSPRLQIETAESYDSAVSIWSRGDSKVSGTRQ